MTKYLPQFSKMLYKYPQKNMISQEIMLQFQCQEEKSHIKNHHLTFLIHFLATSPSTTKTINFSQTLEENNIDHKKTIS